MYDFVLRAGTLVEICDECGFVGDQVEMGDVPARLAEVRRAWSAVMAVDEALLRARPAPATWCVVEYTEHTAFALDAIEWAAHEFVKGRAPDWAAFRPDPLGDATEDNHHCETMAARDAFRAVEESLSSLASFTASLSETDLGATEDYGGGLLLDTSGSFATPSTTPSTTPWTSVATSPACSSRRDDRGGLTQVEPERQRETAQQQRSNRHSGAPAAARSRLSRDAGAAAPCHRRGCGAGGGARQTRGPRRG